MKFVSAVLGLAMLAMAATPPAHADRIGVRNIVAPAPERGIQIDVRLWYPAASGGHSVLIGDNAVFRGAPAFQDAPVASGAYPLILLSFGGLRAAPDLDSWIASRLAAQGFIVAVPRRPGPSELDAAEAPRELWLRPADLSATLTALLHDPFWGDTIDAERVGMLGFQLGGSSVLALAGARIDAGDYVRSCDRGGPGLDCAWFAKHGVDLRRLDAAQVERSHLDPRVRMVVAIDPELADAFTTNSLAGISVPVHVINLGRPEQLLPGLDAAVLAAAIPSARYDVLQEATRFDAFSECKPEGAAILRDEGDDGSLCDGGTVVRARAHEQLAHMISAAFKRHLQTGM